MHYLARDGSVSMARFMMHLPVDLDARSARGWTPCDVAHTFNKPVEEVFKAEALRRDKCVVFAMGQHERLGAGTWVSVFDPGVVRMITSSV